MFVSSYSTHIQTNNSDKVTKQALEKSYTESFSSKIPSKVQTSSVINSNIPINYISQSLVLNNKQNLEDKKNEVKDKIKNDVNKFSKRNSLLNAKKSYEVNAKRFSLLSIPNITLNQTPLTQNTLPKEPQEIKELNLRHKMLNTYIANDKYFKVSA